MNVGKLGGRKFIIALGGEIGLFIFLIIVWQNKMLDMTFCRDWLVAFSGIVIAYMGGNSIEHWTDKKKNGV